MDEPTSRLDPVTRAKVIARLTETAARDGVAIALVGHGEALIRSTADEVLSIAESDGELFPSAPRVSGRAERVRHDRYPR